MTLLDPAQNSYRFVILAFNCLLTLGSYCAFDTPSVLQNELVSQVITPFSPPSGAQTLYSAWYTAYAWCNMCMSLFAGVLVDRWGTSKCSVLFLSLIILFGQSVFILGAFLAPDHATTPLPYAAMFAGRLIFGLGGGPITIVHHLHGGVALFLRYCVKKEEGGRGERGRREGEKSGAPVTACSMVYGRPAFGL